MWFNHLASVIMMGVYVLLVLLAWSASAFEVPELTADNFASKIKEKEYVLVMFYAPWCGHCKKLKPHFDAASAELAETRHNVLLAKVDCTVHGSLCSQYDVTGYPTLKFFSNGVLSGNYDEDRDKAGILRFILRKTKTPVVLSSAVELQELLKNQDSLEQPTVICVASAEDPARKDCSALFSELAEDCVFAYTHDLSVLGISSSSAVVLFRPGNLKYVLESNKLEYDGEFSVTKVKDWVLRHGQGLVGYRSPHNQKYFPKENLLVFYNNASTGSYLAGVNYYRNRLIKLITDADLAKSKLTFAYSDSAEFYQELSELRHDSSRGFPFIAIFSGGLKYKLDVYSPTAFVDFVKEFQAGSLTPFIVSEEIPTEQKDAAIKVVARNFDTVVNDPEKDVLIMFHAPWCGHCKQLMPKFVSAAEQLKGEPSVLLVTFDATANDIPVPYAVHGYPTLYFAPKKAKSAPILYEGARETDSLIEFVAKQATEELVGYGRDGKKKKTEL